MLLDFFFFFFHANFFARWSSENFFPMQGYKRGRSRTRSGDTTPRAMSVSRSRSRGAQAVRVFMAPPGETKYFDTSFGQTIATAADWTGTEVPCTNYIQSDGSTLGAYTDSALIPSAVGSAYGQVVGGKYRIKKIRVRGALVSTALPDLADVPVSNIVRLCLVLDTRPNGAQAQGEEVFGDMGTAAQNSFAFLAMGGGQGGRFRILKDFMVVEDAVTSATDGTNTNSSTRAGQIFQFTWKPRVPFEVILKTSGSTPAIAQLSFANIFLLCHGSLNGTTLSGCSRVYYEG